MHSDIPPITVAVSEGFRLIGESHSGGYRLLAAGKIKAVKSGRSTRLIYSSLIDHVASLPAAVFRTPEAA
jgi:hypothetical protein